MGHDHTTLVGADLSSTVDSVHAASFEGRQLTPAQRVEAARSIAERQGLPGAYADMFALSAAERSAGFRVFTGERMTSASARHIAGEEACAALLSLDVETPEVQTALTRATDGMLAVLHTLDRPGQKSGVFCCGKCCVAVWRHLAHGGLDHGVERMAHGARALRLRRNDKGEWQRFPFAYTVWALTAMPVAEARQELRFVAPVLERRLSRRPRADPHAQRRHAVYERALARI